jgi:hypothetical protein
MAQLEQWQSQLFRNLALWFDGHWRAKGAAMSTQYSPGPRADVDPRHTPVWKQLCLAASLEVDPARLPERIEEARYAILDRIEERFPVKSSDAEQIELRIALEALRSPRATQSWRDLNYLD